MPYFLGIDAGGSKTDCILADCSEVLARTVGPSCKVQRVGAEQSRAALTEAVTTTCARAQVNRKQISATCMGIAGISQQDVAAAMRATLEVLVGGDINIVGDHVIALQSSCRGNPGVVVIAGSGSIAFGRNREGMEARAGGWGPVISDDGSGSAIGRAAVAALMRDYDAGRTTLLKEVILSGWNLNSLEDVVRVANDRGAADFASLFPNICQAAEAKDPTALRVLVEGGVQLAELAENVINRLWQPGEVVRVGIAGGVFRASPVVRTSFYNALRLRRSPVAVNMSIVAPVFGAVELARKAGQAPCPEG